MAVYTRTGSLRKKRLLGGRLRLLLVIAVIIALIIWAVLLITGDKTAAPGSSAPHIADNVKNLDMPDWVTVDLLPVNDYSRPGTKLAAVNNIVIHYVGNPGTTAQQNRKYYSNLAETHETKASSNFLVGIDGEILECVPTDEVAYCSNRRNDDTLSVECCHPDKTGKFTKDTYKSLVKLTAYLCREYGLDSSDLLRHYDITKKECPKYFVDHEDAWETFKNDVQDALDRLNAADTEESPGQ
jgi:N-acetylmuramoyl-L-alanine amidase